MATVLIYFHTQDSLHDFKLFTQKLYPSRFESGSRVKYSEETDRLFLVQSQVIYSPYSSFLGHYPESCSYHNDYNLTKDNHERTSMTEMSNCCCCLNRHQQLKQESYFQLCPSRNACLTLDSHVASCVAHELTRSRIFRANFFKYVYLKSGFSRCFNNIDYCDDVGLIWIPFMLEIQLEYPKQKIDYSWFYRIQSLVILRIKTEEAMALLSTLGGGFSALGDYYEKHSLEAGKIAVRQLNIALTICDPLIAARCYLYIALSLMQRGYLRESKQIIRKQYSFARSHFIRDYRLIAMCKGVWARLKFMYHLQWLKKQGIPCSLQHGILNHNLYNKPQTNRQDECRMQVSLQAF